MTNYFDNLDALVAPALTSDGIRWYSAADTLTALRLSDTALAALSPLDRTTGGSGAMLISEPAFLRMVFQSEVEQAVAFRHWLCLVVLPAIWVSNSYLLNEEAVMKAKVEGVLDMREWKVEHASRYILPLLRKNGFYFSGMEEVSLGIWTVEDFKAAREKAFTRKRTQLRALGFAI